MPISVTAVVFQEEDLWVAQCLEYDIVSFAETLEGLRHRLLGQLGAMVTLDKQEGRVPFEGFKRAPEKYWRIYEDLKARVEPIKPKASIRQRVRAWLTPPPVEALLIPAYT
ncbi:MAG: hypothetical protein ACJ76Y_04220 [Thermoanaerobaculia bacterium]